MEIVNSKFFPIPMFRSVFQKYSEHFEVLAVTGWKAFFFHELESSLLRGKRLIVYKILRINPSSVSSRAVYL